MMLTAVLNLSCLQIVGWAWTATGTHFEGLISTSKGISFADCAAAGNPLLAAAKVPGAGIWQMIFAIGALEVRDAKMIKGSRRRLQTDPRGTVLPAAPGGLAAGHALRRIGGGGDGQCHLPAAARARRDAHWRF